MKYLLIHDDMKRIAELHDQLLKADPHARLYAAATPEAVDKIVGEHHLSLAFASLRLWHTGWLRHCEAFPPPVVLLRGPHTAIKGEMLQRYPLLLREPVTSTSFRQVLEHSASLTVRPDTFFITVYDEDHYVAIPVFDIDYLTYAQYYVGIHTGVKTFTKRISLEKMIGQLSCRPFYIVHPGLAMPVDWLAALETGMHAIDRQFFEYTPAMKKEVDMITEMW